MPAKTSKPTDPWAALDALIKFVPEPTGPEWFTVAQFASRYSLSEGQARKRCCDMAKQGVLDHWLGGSAASNGRITNKYRVKEGPPRPPVLG